MTISLVVLFGIGVVVAVRGFGLSVWQALLCTLFGLYLAESGIAPMIRQVVTQLVRIVSGLHF